jgi:phage tail sheath protein FI
MPEYLYPGVYVEEVDSGNQPIEGVSTSTCGFLGITERGAITPTLCTSFGDYQRAFGGYGATTYLAYAVEGFFQNGGLRCFVERVVHIDTETPANSAQPATVTVGGLTISAIGPGAWGNNMAYQISNAGLQDPTLFKLTVLYWAGTPSPDLVSNPTLTEVYDNLSSVPTASTFYSSEINGASNLITVTQNAPGRPANNTLNAAGNDPNELVGSLAVTPATALTIGATLTLGSAPASVTFKQNSVSPGPIIIYVSDLIDAINADTTVGAHVYLNSSGTLTLVDPQGRGKLAVTGTLASATANLGPFTQSSLNLLVSGDSGFSPITALTDTGTLILTSGAATVTFTVNAAAGPIKVIADLIKAINADAVVGAKATLDTLGRLNIQDPQTRNNIGAGGTLTAAGSGLGSFSNASGTQNLNGAGTPLLLTRGTDGVNPNTQVGVGVGTLALTTPLANLGNLVITSPATPSQPVAQSETFTVSAVAPVIQTVGDLINAINLGSTVGAQASLVGGQFVVQDLLMRGNIQVTGSLQGTGAGDLGMFASATATMTEADFQGNDINPAAKTGLLALGDVDEISLLCCPDEYYFGPGNPAIADMLVEQCESQMDRFAILEASPATVQPENNNPSVNSEYAAYYYPWLTITNADTGVNMLVPPCGHIAGIYARSDTNYGVQKDPANEIINGIYGLQLPTNNQQQAILNPKGVNCLRYFKGSGNLVWGGRTTSNDPDWTYVSVRRIFIFVETSIKLGTQWAVFQGNDDQTWRKLVRSVEDFLNSLWRDGVLQGDTADQAYFVKCDMTTMTQADIDNGRLICLIGIAPVKPAEFVIFRIGQWEGGSSVTEQ